MRAKLKLSYIMHTLLILSNLIFVHNTFALSYSSDVNIGFTFNPTLSVSLSSSDLTISNLTPGNTGSSNEITVNVATNAANGYTLSATVGNNSAYSTDSLINSVDNNKVFSNIATDANLSLSDIEASESTNIWGYSYKNNTDTTPAWSNYNGLPLYSSTGTTLIDNSSTADGAGNIDFKIAAKASSTQASGVYNNVINFTAVSKVVPLTLLESFIAHNATQYNSYFTMQGMTPAICKDAATGSSMQLLDVRDNKFYWVTKLADENCWMTQNLDLDLSHEVALTSETSDIDPESYGKTMYTNGTGYSKDEATGVVSWLPSTIDSNNIQRVNTIIINGDTASGWANNNNNPYSADPGNMYRYTNSSYTENNYTSLEACTTANNVSTAECQHGHYGNFYNWSAAVASNNTSGASGTQTNSICPKNWDLPANSEYSSMLTTQDVYNSNTYIKENNINVGFQRLITTPLYFARFGYVNSVGGFGYLGSYGWYWSSTVIGNATSYSLLFNSNNIWPSYSYYDSYKSYGLSVRCMASSS